MLFNAAAALLLAVAARAIQITSPAQGTSTSSYKTGEAVTIQWTSVSTDAQSINIVLRSKQSDRWADSNIAQNVQTSAGSYSWTPSESGDDFRIAFLSAATNTNQNGILAESGDFAVTQGSGAVSSSASSSAVGSSSALPSGTTSSPNVAGTHSAPSGSNAPRPSGSVVAPGGGASALVPSVALVGGSLLALML